MKTKLYKSFKFRIDYICYLKKMISFFKNNNKKKKCIVLGTPHHTNAGDNAQSMCIEEWASNNLSDYKYIEFLDEFTERYDCFLLKIVKKYIKSDDIIILHSGYHTTDLYPAVEHIQSTAVKLFPFNKLIFFPQTVNFKSLDYQRKVSKLYNEHKNAVFMCRDNVSFDISKKIFNKLQLLLFPDIVTSLIGKYSFKNQRNGIYVCLRSGLESKITNEEKSQLFQYLDTKYNYTIGDTDLQVNVDFFINNRKKVIEGYINELSKYKLVITDRYHGMIFALVANTPVIVIPSTDHKLESGVKWFEDVPIIKEYILFEKDNVEVLKKIDCIMEKPYAYKLPPYYQEVYYDKLKESIM